MVKGFAHIALYTNRFDATIAFYEKVFAAENLGYFQTERKGCWLSIGGDILEIFESDALGEGCFKHIGIACDNVDELFQRALDCGAAAHVQPKDICLDLKEPQEARIAFVKGINGEQIELFMNMNKKS